MSERRRWGRILGIAAVAALGAGLLLALPAAGFAADAADTGEPARHRHPRLSDEQRACLETQGLTRPLGRLDADERAALRSEVEAAAEECGIEAPVGRFGHGPGRFGHGPGCDHDVPEEPAEPSAA